MILKPLNTQRTNYSQFDLLGNNEVALSKAFAYLLSFDAKCYFQFLRFIGIRAKNTQSNFKQAQIEIERFRDEGRTDIELSHTDKYHVIIECKIKKGKISKQRTQYIKSFEKPSSNKVLCLLTQEKDTNKKVPPGVIIKNISWLDVIELFNKKGFVEKEIVQDFLKFTTKNYKMRELKEILIQGLGDRIQITRFKEYNIYRRDQTFGTPIYFAPYFNRYSGEIEGITKLSKILGILTFKPSEIENFRSDLESFTEDKSIINIWIAGIRYGNDRKNQIYTFYFLDNPFTFPTALRKDGGIQKGRGKNWIAANIPPNRCVSFTEFIRHIPELSLLNSIKKKPENKRMLN